MAAGNDGEGVTSDAENRRQAILASPLRWPIAIIVLFLFAINIFIWFYYVLPPQTFIEHQACETVTTSTTELAKTNSSMEVKRTCKGAEPGIIVPIAAGTLGVSILASIFVIFEVSISTPYGGIAPAPKRTEAGRLAAQSHPITEFAEDVMRAGDQTS